MSFNFVAAVTIHSVFGAPENEVCHCFHLIPIKEGCMISPHSWKTQRCEHSRVAPRVSVNEEFRQLSPRDGAVPEVNWHLMPVTEGPHRPRQIQLSMAPRDSGLWAHLFGQEVIDVYDSSQAHREHLWKESTFFRLLEGWRISLPLRKRHSPENRPTCQFPHLGASVSLSFPRWHWDSKCSHHRPGVSWTVLSVKVFYRL